MTTGNAGAHQPDRGKQAPEGKIGGGESPQVTPSINTNSIPIEQFEFIFGAPLRVSFFVGDASQGKILAFINL